MNARLNRCCNLLLLTLAMESLCALIGESFALQLSNGTWFWLALLCLFLWISTGYHYGILIGMPLSGALFYYLYRYHTDNLSEQLRDLADHISAAYYGQFSSSGTAAVSESMTTHTLAVLLILFVVAAFVSTALVSGSFRVSLSLIATAPFFAVCIAINGTPSILPVFGLLLFWCGLQLGGDVFRSGDAAGKSLLIGIIPCLIVLSSLLLLYRPSNYVPDEKDFDLSKRFDKLGNALSQWLEEDEDRAPASYDSHQLEAGSYSYHAPSAWNHGLDQLNLTLPFDYEELNKVAFRFNSDANGVIYIRGRCYGDYNGTFWSPAIENSHSHSLSYTAQAIASSGVAVDYQFQIQTPVPYDLFYLPYYSISDSVGDVFIPSSGISAYSGDFYQPADTDTISTASYLPPSLQDEELQYREYVHTYYTRLPDSTKKILAKLCSQYGFEPGQSNLIHTIAEFVQLSGSYDVSVGTYPSDDYAVYFLTNSHRGYCIHFATAATTLYRYLGIPARVCEGYLVNAKSGNHMTVTGADAHAWVEVYLDGTGWIPVEVTAPENETDDTSIGRDTAPSPMENESEEEIFPSVNPSFSPESGENDDTSDIAGSSLPDNSQKDDVTPASAKEISGPLRIILTVLFILIIACALFLLRYKLIRHSILSRLSEEDGRTRAIHIYRQAERVVRFGGDIPEMIRITAEKARFSPHEIEPGELADCTEALNKLTGTQYSNLSKWKKFYFRFIACNI